MSQTSKSRKMFELRLEVNRDNCLDIEVDLAHFDCIFKDFELNTRYKDQVESTCR